MYWKLFVSDNLKMIRNLWQECYNIMIHLISLNMYICFRQFENDIKIEYILLQNDSFNFPDLLISDNLKMLWIHLK